MNIGGFQKVSLIDFDNNITAIVFTQGCNFRCPFCYNQSLVLPDKFSKLIDEDYVIDYLKNRNKLLTAVTITGGEPALQRDLFSFIDKVKSLGYIVKVDTNGSDIEAVKKLVKIVDYIAMDVKSSSCKHARASMSTTSFDTIKESIRVIDNSNIACEFRTTCVPTLVEGKDIEQIASLLPKRSKYFLQRFENNNILDNTLTVAPYDYETTLFLKGIASKYVDTYIRGFNV